ncbi:MAG: hypothetical protein J7L19_07000 [Dehalococcoidia bacterium]|nr:hypothetical protein [Dehalococcoidia bacterium]
MVYRESREHKREEGAIETLVVTSSSAIVTEFVMLPILMPQAAVNEIGATTHHSDNHPILKDG